MTVRELISELNADGWFQVRQSGSHRIFRHAKKKGSVTVPGALGIELSKSTLASIVRQAGLEGGRDEQVCGHY
ncbi:MAG: type II toxin-antitoxin system HicA family toxin [Acidimicrobiaceae bacterium]|nr:type II toxin-antitoxin system HicA family toxin [Acidimicrobiaceae bacterium]